MSSSTPYKLLIAEDDVPSFELLQIYLEDFNVSITHVDNGRDLLEKCKSDDFDIVITDNRMPLLNGLEVIEMIREEDKETPFIAISGNIFEEDKQECLEAGFNGYLNKPVKPSVFINELKKHLPQLSN